MRRHDARDELDVRKQHVHPVCAAVDPHAERDEDQMNAIPANGPT
jgi:hypothetical protein